MKKINVALILTTLILGNSVMANSAIATDSMLNLISFSSNQTHEFRMIDDLKFRYEEYNDYKDVDENKAKQSQEEFKLTEPAMQKIYNSRPQPSQNVQFVEQDGQIKIQSIQ